jgi:hypothetical protein
MIKRIRKAATLLFFACLLGIMLLHVPMPIWETGWTLAAVERTFAHTAFFAAILWVAALCID